MGLRDCIMEETRFDFDFWLKALSELGYDMRLEELDVGTLVEKKVFPRSLGDNLRVEGVRRFLSTDYVEGALILVSGSLTKSSATRVARSWKRMRLLRPLLIFSDGEQSVITTVPGPGSEGEARVFNLSERLYHTDVEVLESMRFDPDPERYKERYDREFLPYEKVRNEFFRGYRELYARIEEAVRPVFGTAGIEAESSAYAQRFLGRLMFIYFIQKKGWINSDKRYIDSVKDVSELNLLFYEGFNRKDSPLGVPYLNGSLFDREEYMDRLEGALERVLEPLFFQAREFFNRYNFTVDESSPMDIDVSLDPSMIGTVFENMLPENQRGAKGTYYTPPAETAFIIRRALSAYLGLKDRVIEDAGGKRFVDGLTAYLEELADKKSERDVRELREKLLSLRILDPAVGSGGFLVAAMEEIVDILKEADATVGFKTDVEMYKERILPNLIGFDIEKEAVEIARLRLWLSLVIAKKEPEALPNLDLNIVETEDSLQKGQYKLDIYVDREVKNMLDELQDLREKYVRTHTTQEKREIKSRFDELAGKLERKTGSQQRLIEIYSVKPDIVVMNPPYIRQEELDQSRKQYYSSVYSLDKKSDIYVYFILRGLELLSEGGALAAITSDKWLETSYGVSFQEKVKPHLLAVYGQRKRSFGADVNTVISVYSKRKLDEPVSFTYLESFASERVVRHVSLPRSTLRPGKWFYLKAPEVFTQKILPKLTHRLGDFAEIKFGLKTGANEFFYMKDVSHLFEADRLADPEKFERWGVKARTSKELEEQGLIYIENEGGGRFVLERASVRPIIRSIKDYVKPHISGTPSTLCLYVDNLVGSPFTEKYIRHGEAMEVEVGRGSNKGVVKGYHNLSTVKARTPWYKLPQLKPTTIFLSEFYSARFLSLFSDRPLLADHLFELVYPDSPSSERALRLYLNSTVHFLMLELWTRRMGGGVLHPLTVDYKSLPVPDFGLLSRSLVGVVFGDRPTLDYSEEVKQEDRRRLDLAVLRGLGFSEADAGAILDEMYQEYLEVVRDRLIKAGRSLAERVEEGGFSDVDGEVEVE